MREGVGVAGWGGLEMGRRKEAEARQGRGSGGLPPASVTCCRRSRSANMPASVQTASSARRAFRRRARRGSERAWQRRGGRLRPRQSRMQRRVSPLARFV